AGSEGAIPAARGFGPGVGGPRQARRVSRRVVPAAAFPARRAVGVVAAGGGAACRHEVLTAAHPTRCGRLEPRRAQPGNYLMEERNKGNQMMQHAFLSIDTIKGESRDAEHKDWIEIESFNQDVLQPRSAT